MEKLYQTLIKKKKNQNIAKVDFRIRNTNKYKESIFIMNVKGDS